MRPPQDGPPPDWRNLGNWLRAERDGRPVPQIAAAAGISIMSIYAYESGRSYARPPAKMWRLVNFYRWTPDSLDTVLAGGAPQHRQPMLTRAQAAAAIARIRADASLATVTRDIVCAAIADLIDPADPNGIANGSNGSNGDTASAPLD